MISIIDYGLSNIRSVVKAFEHLEIPTTLVGTPDGIANAEKLFLPGVGAFAAGMDGLRQHGLVEPIQAAAKDGVPLMGICLGMQLLFDWGEEDGLHEGLGILPGRVVRFADINLPIPHMGWNQLEFVRESKVTAGLNNGRYTYFVHSYHCQPDDPAMIIAKMEYERPFVSIVGHKNIYGLQFHPEKSQATGLRMLRNFAK